MALWKQLIVEEEVLVPTGQSQRISPVKEVINHQGKKEDPTAMADSSPKTEDSFGVFQRRIWMKQTLKFNFTVKDYVKPLR